MMLLRWNDGRRRWTCTVLLVIDATDATEKSKVSQTANQCATKVSCQKRKEKKNQWPNNARMARIHCGDLGRSRLVCPVRIIICAHRTASPPAQCRQCIYEYYVVLGLWYEYIKKG